MYHNENWFQKRAAYSPRTAKIGNNKKFQRNQNRRNLDRNWRKTKEVENRTDWGRPVLDLGRNRAYERAHRSLSWKSIVFGVEGYWIIGRGFE